MALKEFQQHSKKSRESSRESTQRAQREHLLESTKESKRLEVIHLEEEEPPALKGLVKAFF